jgi:hypothetical protein
MAISKEKRATLPIKRVGGTERSRYTSVVGMVNILTGVESLDGLKSFPELLDYAKNPPTEDTVKHLEQYINLLSKSVGHIKYQVNMAHWMRQKRAKAKLLAKKR